MLLLKVKQKVGLSLMFMLKKLAHLALSFFFQFAVVILHNEQSTTIEIYGSKSTFLYHLWLASFPSVDLVLVEKIVLVVWNSIFQQLTLSTSPVCSVQCLQNLVCFCPADLS
jgi:hypothetical protein